ncbi:hypothetical protein INF35_12345 [Subdoligranulum sp. DSM 109015]|uniref:Uncharacterized protein n=1 Tax=Gemmiger gallinarum TaxID=2779354 RepID=A0ABR9R610_9FIRM|nr:hypothetical protein [Gemmiger gallinarum]MBE5038579.1 hypothetical protein [Gemmiger gallinarum]
MKKHEPFEDDGRTIADMSGVEMPSLFLPRKPRQPGQDNTPRETSGQDRPWEEQEELTAGQKFWVILGALKAALLIGSVYLVGLGLIILLMVLFW